MNNEQKQRALKALEKLAQSEQGEELPAALKMAEVLRELIEQPAANTPIQELMARYADEWCDFSDLRWLRQTARRLATTMPDSQARCILFALAERPASVPDADLARDAERYRWLRDKCQRHDGGLTIAKSTRWSLEPWSDDDPDRKIDAAIAAEKGGA